MREIPVDSTGGISGTRDAKVDGDVKNAVEMLRKLAKSEHVEQVFIRHAFRYWMGRNERFLLSPRLADGSLRFTATGETPSLWVWYWLS